MGNRMPWALEQLAAGARIYRDGWPDGVRVWMYAPCKCSKVTAPFAVISGADSLTIPWTANQADLTAGDWAAEPKA